MKITLNWLKQYVDIDWSAEELSERLTMIGIEVESMQSLGGEFEGVVVAEVLTRDKHPNADKLSLCRVNDGKSERQIVCGAQNFKAGDRVPLVLPGHSLPAKAGQQPFTIKVGKIRGVESHGMLCSPQELGLGDSVDGLLILREDAKPGMPFAEYLGRAGGDVIYDLEITPNRPDWSSLIGIAREVAAVSGEALKIPTIPNLSPADIDGRVEDLAAVRIEDPELCPRYTARVVRGLKAGKSPDWLSQTLEKVGIRSINNIVDVTNYVMLETGQPLHAFDYHLLQRSNSQPRPTVVIRRAQEGEKFATLDGQERTLTAEMLLIADETRAIALAGVMGGQNTEINLNTVDVLIESACFKPQNIRATSKRLELRTESSYRFERGADIGICDFASQRALQLILQTAGGKVAAGVVDAYPRPAAPREIRLRHSQTNAIAGIDIPEDQQIASLQRLGLEVSMEPGIAPGSDMRTPRTTAFRIPSFRVDLKREVDLIEEVVRLYGIDKIPATPPRGAIGSNPYDAIHDELAEARRVLAGLGFYEAQGQTLISEAAAKLVVGEGVIPLANPLSSDMNVLRPSLLPGMLDALRHNSRHNNHDVCLFELGRVFVQGNEKETTCREGHRLALAMTGLRFPLFWAGEQRDEKVDVYDLKGAIEEFLEQFGIRGVTYSARGKGSSLFLESATVQLGKQQIGEFGQLPPALAKRYDLRDRVLLAEFDFNLLLARRNTGKSFKPMPAFPSIRRDVAMLLPDATPNDVVLSVIRQGKAADLESVQLFDVFRGKNVPAGQKSVAYAFTYRHAQRTLTDAEVNSAHEKLVELLKRELKATIRDQ